jgi:hypothetical protein
MVTADDDGHTATSRPPVELRTWRRRPRARRVVLWRAPGIALLTVMPERACEREEEPKSTDETPAVEP